MSINVHSVHEGYTPRLYVLDSNVIELIHQFISGSRRDKGEYRELESILPGSISEESGGDLDRVSLDHVPGLIERCWTRTGGMDERRYRDYFFAIGLFSRLKHAQFRTCIDKKKRPEEIMELIARPKYYSPKSPFALPGFPLYYLYTLKVMSEVWKKWGEAGVDDYRDARLLEEVLGWIAGGVPFTPMPVVWMAELFDGRGAYADKAAKFAKLKRKKNKPTCADDVARAAWNMAWDFTYFMWRDQLASEGAAAAVVSRDRDSVEIARSYHISHMAYFDSIDEFAPLSELSVHLRDAELERALEDVAHLAGKGDRMEDFKEGRISGSSLQDCIVGLEREIGCSSSIGVGDIPQPESSRM